MYDVLKPKPPSCLSWVLATNEASIHATTNTLTLTYNFTYNLQLSFKCQPVVFLCQPIRNNPCSTAWKRHLGHHGFATSIRKGRLHTAARWKRHQALALRLFGSAPKDHGAEWPGRAMSAPKAALQDSNEKVGKVLRVT